jgi:hypothetical protein
VRPGQKAKYSLRADVFRFGPNNGHRSTGSVCPFRANNRNALIRSPDLRGRVTAEALRDPRRFAVVIATQLDNQANLRFIKGCAVGPIFFDRLNNLLSRLL